MLYYYIIILTNSEHSEHVPIEVLSGRKRRSFSGKDRPIPPFNTSLKHATFQLSETNTTCNNMVTRMVSTLCGFYKHSRTQHHYIMVTSPGM